MAARESDPFQNPPGETTRVNVLDFFVKPKHGLV